MSTKKRIRETTRVESASYLQVVLEQETEKLEKSAKVMARAERVLTGEAEMAPRRAERVKAVVNIMLSSIVK